MAIEIKPDEITVSEVDQRREAKRRREIVRRFTDQFVDVPIVITPRWQKAIDNYKRAKGIEAVEEAE